MKKQFIRRLFLVVLGQVIISAGITLMLFINLGADPLGVFHTGVANILNISFAKAILLENLFVVIIVYFIDKKYINIATIITLFVVSLTTGYFDSLYNFIFPSEMSFIFRVVVLLLACFILAVGLNFYVLPKLGVGAMDIPVEMLVDKKGYIYQRVKVLTDLMFLVACYFLGGVVGIGTVISAFAVGPFIQITRKFMSEPIKKFIES